MSTWSCGGRYEGRRREGWLVFGERGRGGVARREERNGEARVYQGAEKGPAEECRVEEGGGAARGVSRKG